MFRPVVAIIRFYHSTRLRLFYTIRVAACLMRRSQHQNPCRSIVLGVLGVWVNHVIIHKNITLYYQNKNKNKKHEGPVLGKPLVVSSKWYDEYRVQISHQMVITPKLLC